MIYIICPMPNQTHLTQFNARILTHSCVRVVRYLCKKETVKRSAVSQCYPGGAVTSDNRTLEITTPSGGWLRDIGVNTQATYFAPWMLLNVLRIGHNVLNDSTSCCVSSDASLCVIITGERITQLCEVSFWVGKGAGVPQSQMLNHIYMCAKPWCDAFH